MSCVRTLSKIATVALNTSGSCRRVSILPSYYKVSYTYRLGFLAEQRCCHTESSTVPIVNGVTVEYKRGLPVVTLPLPSRREKCQFTLKPVSSNVGDFLRDLQNEDKGIDRIAVYTQDGTRISASTGLDVLLSHDFVLIINDMNYAVSPPSYGRLIHEDARTMADVRSLVSTLYSALNVEQHQLEKERELVKKLENLKTELEPLEKKKQQLVEYAEQRTSIMKWTGLGLMGFQFGILARLTWWEYSWDIMEPVTYFVTYGTVMAMYAYFVLTNQEYNFADVHDRHWLLKFHKKAKDAKLDVTRYNNLQNQIAQIEMDLERLRDPLTLNLPIPPITKEEIKLKNS